MGNTKKILSIGLIIATLAMFSSCETKETPTETQKPPAKQVSVFTVGETSTRLSFTKSGQVESSKTAFVMPEIAGKILQIKVKVGDEVSKNQTLVTLGNSLSTEVTNISYDTAIKGLDLLDTSRLKMDYGAQKDIESVMIGYYSAKESLENTINSKDSAEDLYDEQHDYLEDQVDDLENALDDMKEIPNYKQDEAYQSTKATYKQLKSQLEQAEISHEAQMDQVDFGIEMAKKQLESAILAVEGVQAKYSLQFIQLDSSLLQAQSGADLIKLQKEAQNVKSPIKGVVTQIQGKEGNPASPGQILLTVENTEELNLKTYLSIEEIKLINTSTIVSISSPIASTTGKITSVSPTVSQNGKAEVEITLNNNPSIISGEIVDITFTATPPISTTFVPLNSLIIEDDKYFINTISQEKTIARKEVSIGKIFGEYVEIRSGLNTGDKVAISTTFLRDGEKVVYKVKRLTKKP